MKLFPRAQSILEYCLLVIVIAAGVIIMSPYVIRSTNAYFKSWEDAADDSFNDPLVKAGTGGLPTVSCSCDVSFKDQGCGTGGCAQTARYYKRSCSPVGCSCVDLPNPPPGHTDKDCDECLVDNACCTPPVSAGSCGDPACGGDPLQKPMTTTCGASPPKTQCIADAACQPFTCQGNVPQNATLCPGDDTGLTGQTFNSVVDSCTSNSKCEYTCDAGYQNQAGVCQPAGPCPPGEVQCFAVTKTGKWTADFWENGNTCKSGNSCDPWGSCSLGMVGNSGCGQDTICENGAPACKNCVSSVACGPFTGYGSDAATASANATTGLLQACAGSCGYKDSNNAQTGGNCSSCCPSTSFVNGGRAYGVSTFLCIGESSAAAPVCLPGNSCP